MDLELKDKVVIVTGGAKGIGSAIVHACAAEGAVPVIIGRDAEAGKKLRSEIQDKGSRCGLISVDLSTPQSCEQSVAQTAKEFGRLDALVNNAGRNDKVGLEEGSPAQYVAGSWFNRERWLKDRRYRTGEHFGLCIVKGSDYGPHARVGSRIVAIQDPRQYGDSCGGDDAPLPKLAGHLPESG